MRGSSPVKVAIVTGAGLIAEGIDKGRAVAILFARKGAKVLLVGRIRERLIPILEAIENGGGKAALSWSTSLMSRTVLQWWLKRSGDMVIDHHRRRIYGRTT
jgi:NAD(P)-dependent dehydrogenase (short-subunit alcohol dehydrogenase family)